MMFAIDVENNANLIENDTLDPVGEPPLAPHGVHNVARSTDL
jgi:hypothetical protein